MLARIVSPLILAAAMAVPAFAQTAGQEQPAVEPPAAQAPAAEEPAAGAAGQTAAGPSAGDPTMGSLTSDTLLGKQARNPEGQELGNIENLVIDPQSGQVTHVVVSVGGFLGIGDKEVAIPWNDLNMQQEALVVDATREELEAAQPFREEAAAAPGGTAGQPGAPGAPPTGGATTAPPGEGAGAGGAR